MAIHRLNWQQMPPGDCQGGAVTIGNFDGVHRGHARLATETHRQAQLASGPAIALIFDPHPLQILRPEKFLPLLTTVDDRGELLQSCGADQVLVLQTTPDLLLLSPEEFFQQVILDHLGARAVVEGINFGFGRNRAGNIDTLSDLCRNAGLALAVVPPVEFEGETVSSSRIRSTLELGAVSLAARHLDRPYRLRGRVGTGQRRGSTLGFPTANLEQIETLLPGNGVYAVRVLHAGQVWPGAANIGPNPTFGENARKIEIHLIGFSGDLYGQELAVDFIERLRDTRPFSGVTELQEQLRRDIEQARQLASIS